MVYLEGRASAFLDCLNHWHRLDKEMLDRVIAETETELNNAMMAEATRRG
ncbi:MAG: hypothetical protein JNK21_03490 [Rhodospirillaceae bacterium]|nr:hypothetical protein [Rhodospirillaceae bacterium]